MTALVLIYMKNNILGCGRKNGARGQVLGMTGSNKAVREKGNHDSSLRGKRKKLMQGTCEHRLLVLLVTC